MAAERAAVRGNLVEVLVDGMDASGDGTARAGAIRLTVPFTIPGERVRVAVGAVRAGRATGSLSRS